MINLALLGFGRIGKKYLSSSYKSKQFIIKKILRKNKRINTPKNIQFFTNFQRLIKSKGIDGYIVATPVTSHFEYAKKIFKLNKPLIIEKPLTNNLIESKELLKLFRKFNKPIFVNHSDLFNPAFIKFYDFYKKIGIIKKIDIIFGKYQEISKQNNGIIIYQ